MTTTAPPASGRPIRIAYLLVPQFPMMSFAAAIEPMRSANRMSERRLFEWTLVSAEGTEVEASNGIRIPTECRLDQLKAIDLLVVCAGLEPAQFGAGHLRASPAAQARAPWCHDRRHQHRRVRFGRCRPPGRSPLYRALGVRGLVPIAPSVDRVEPGSVRRGPKRVHVLGRHRRPRHDAAFRGRGGRPRHRHRGGGTIHSSADSPAGRASTLGRACPLPRRQPETGGNHQAHGERRGESARHPRARRARRYLRPAGGAAVSRTARHTAEGVLPEAPVGAREDVAAADRRSHPRRGRGVRVHVDVRISPMPTSAYSESRPPRSAGI